MNKEEFEITKQKYENSKELNDIHNNPLIQATLDFFLGKLPFFGDLVKASLNDVLAMNQSKKQEKLRDTIINSDNYMLIPKEKVEDVDFITNLLKASDMVKRISSDEKIVYMGNLLRNGYLGKEKISNDDFDEYSAMICDLSYREIDYLIQFSKYIKRCGNPLRGDTLKEYCENMLEKYPRIKPQLMLNRLKRTGFISEEKTWVDFGDIDEPTTSRDEALFLGNENSYILEEAFYDFEKMILESVEL